MKPFLRFPHQRKEGTIYNSQWGMGGEARFHSHFLFPSPAELKQKGDVVMRRLFRGFTPNWQQRSDLDLSQVLNAACIIFASSSNPSDSHYCDPRTVPSPGVIEGLSCVIGLLGR